MIDAISRTGICKIMKHCLNYGYCTDLCLHSGYWAAGLMYCVDKMSTYYIM